MSKQNHDIPKDYKEAEATGEQPLAGAVVGDAKPSKPEAKQKNQPTVAPNGAVVSNIDGHSLSNKTRIIIFAVLGVLVLASAGWLLLHKSPKPSGTEQSKNTDPGSEDFVPNKVSYEQSVSGNSIETRKVATSAPTVESGKSADYIKSYQLAISSLESGDYNAAIQQFELALKTSDEKTYSFYSQVGLTYAAVGNNAKAVEYLKLAKSTYNNKQAPLDSQDTKDGINKGFDMQIAEYSK
jgi:TolA-binding protein